MKSIALPIIYGTNRIYVDRGIRWTAVEHAILWLTCKKNITARDATEISNLPYRLVVEILSRLMKAGWVNAHESTKGVTFSSTEQGLAIVDSPDLPRIPKPADRVAKFVLEGFYGGCFRHSDFTRIVSEARLNELSKREEIITLPGPSMPRHSEPSEIMEILLQDEETFIKYGEDPPRTTDRFALLRANNTTIYGLPSSASEELKKLILYYTKNINGANPQLNNENILAREEYSPKLSLKNARIDIGDALIVGGPAHLKAIREALSKAEELVVIHSTFVSLRTFELLYDDFYSAYERGIRIQILWGQGAQGDRRGLTSESVRRCESYLKERSNGASIVSFEYFSTGSHSKIIAFDLKSGHMACIIGSCNWLSSSYDSLECSIRVRDPALVVPILRYLTELARPTPGGTSPLIGALVRKIMQLRGSPYTLGATVSATLIRGGEHNAVVNLSRDEAKHKIKVFSHRLGDGANNLILSPLIAASKQRGIEVDIYFSKDDRGESPLVQKNTHDLRLHQSTEPRLHAKCLWWDERYVLITSQNLCSADPPDGAHLSELGILIQSPDLARKFSDAFNIALGDNQDPRPLS